MMTLDHVGIAVRHLGDAAQVYETLFGLTITERYELPAEGVRIAFVRSGAVDLEFLEPVGEGGPPPHFWPPAARGCTTSRFAYPISRPRWPLRWREEPLPLSPPRGEEHEDP